MISVSIAGSMVKQDSWYYLGSTPPSLPADDVNPSSLAFDDIASAGFAFLASPGVLLDELTFPADAGTSIATSIANGTAASVSDGSFDGVPYGVHRLATLDGSLRVQE